MFFSTLIASLIQIKTCSKEEATRSEFQRRAKLMVFFYFDSFPNSNKNLLKRSTDTFRISTESKVNYLFKGRDHELYSTLKGRGQKPQLS